MSIEVSCSQCNASHHVHNRMAGRRVRCPQCEAVVEVPQPEIPEPEAPVVDSDDPPLNRFEDQDVSLEGLSPRFSDPNERSDKIASPTLSHGLFQDPHAGERFGEHHVMVLDGEDDEDADDVLVRQKRPEEEMDMTPMVDVTFLLLIFFMVTAAFSLQKSIEMPRQQTDQPSLSVNDEETEDLDMVEVQVDEFGSFLVMAPDWERETPGKQNLISTLKEAAGNNNDGMRLVIKVHELAKLHALVDAMDAGTIAGYAQLEVTQVEEFD